MMSPYKTAVCKQGFCFSFLFLVTIAKLPFWGQRHHLYIEETFLESCLIIVAPSSWSQKERETSVSGVTFDSALSPPVQEVLISACR